MFHLLRQDFDTDRNSRPAFETRSVSMGGPAPCVQHVPKIYYQQGYGPKHIRSTCLSIVQSDFFVLANTLESSGTLGIVRRTPTLCRCNMHDVYTAVHKRPNATTAMMLKIENTKRN